MTLRRWLGHLLSLPGTSNLQTGYIEFSLPVFPQSVIHVRTPHQTGTFLGVPRFWENWPLASFISLCDEH